VNGTCCSSDGLYQQVPAEKAPAGPAVLADRLGVPLDAETTSEVDSQKLEDVFREKPALHRFPANMAKRTEAVASFIVDEYDGDPAGVWDGVDSGAELQRRIKEMLGFGE
jgi:uncharacterized HhH-GPD family protein